MKPINAFDIIFGIRKGHTVEKAIEFFGEPANRKQYDEYEFNGIYYDYNGLLTLGVLYYKDNNKIYAFEIRHGIQPFISNLGIVEEKLNYLNKGIFEIEAEFGTPKEKRQHSLDYKYNDTRVSFLMYDPDKPQVCSDIGVYWF